MTTLSKAVLAGIGFTMLIAYAITIFRRTKQLWSGLLCLGAILLMIVVLRHVAEALHLWPSMRWGEPTSPGHYLDLASAILGLVLVSIECVLALADRLAGQPR
jgi:predicted small integral membrane protein